jgi:hypothetical protein
MLDSKLHCTIKSGLNFNHVFIQYFRYYSELSSITRFVKNNIIDLRLEVMKVRFGLITLSCLVLNSLALEIVKDTDLQLA